MRVKDIEALLIVFYEGNTTLEQEVALRRFFESEEVPDYLLSDKYEFLACFIGEDIDVPASLEKDLEAMIDQGNVNRRSGKVLRMTWIWFASVAASLILLFTIGHNVYQSNQMPKMADTFTNPKDAARETQKALLLVSKNLSSGYAHIQKAETTIYKSQTTLTNQLNKLSK